jgi:hypothetical protein
MTLWQASICCTTKGLDGAVKTIFPASEKNIASTTHERKPDQSICITPRKK